MKYKSIALIDLNYLFKKRYHTIGNETPFAAARETLKDLEKLKQGVEHVILCRDAPPYKFRLDIYPQYKANRPAVEPEERAQKKWLFEEITRLGYSVGWCEGYEADDVIATLAFEYGQWCNDVRIVCPDKDASQCVRDNVLQYIPPATVGSEWVIRDRAGVVDKFGVTPELFPLYQALCGDKDDNVPGVKGIGKVKAKELVNEYPGLALLSEAMAANAKSKYVFWRNLSEQWLTGFMLSLKLVTLVTSVPVDAQALLEKLEPTEEKPAPNDMAPRNTPVPPALPRVKLHADGTTSAKASPEYDAAFEQAKKVYDAKFVDTRAANDAPPESTTASKDDALIEQEYDREREENEEHEAREAATPPAPPQKTALAKAPPVALVHPQYGAVDNKLQPLDLGAAYTISEWIVKSNLFPQFKRTSQVFVVIAQGRELGVGMITALSNTHMIEGKPVKHADFIRALAEKDPTFEYLYPAELGPTRCVWVGKRKGTPKEVTFPYTIEDAIQAGLCGSGTYGSKSNWTKRPQDMLSKTAASKLARILWPAATMGFYCPEEMGSSEEELAELDRAA